MEWYFFSGKHALKEEMAPQVIKGLGTCKSVLLLLVVQDENCVAGGEEGRRRKDMGRKHK